MHRILTLLLQREFLVPVRDSTPKMLAYLTCKLESVFILLDIPVESQVSTFCILSPTYESGLLTVNAPFSEYSHIIAEIFRHEFSEQKPVCAALHQRCSSALPPDYSDKGHPLGRAPNPAAPLGL